MFNMSVVGNNLNLTLQPELCAVAGGKDKWI